MCVCVHWEVLDPFSLHGSYDFCDRKHFPRANQDLTAALLSTAREVWLGGGECMVTSDPDGLYITLFQAKFQYDFHRNHCFPECCPCNL